jgi:tetratricopeptide (TPR) repeat protein
VCYSNLRYYWYGLYPYSWYGCYPIAYETGSDTYNYYTYNTYNYDSGTSQDYTTSEYSGPLEGVDETTFEDVRQKLEQQRQQQPDEETITDKFFDDGVKAFEQGDYGTAAKAFADAIALEPNDLILPFAYVQALFASEQYSRAAVILRSALERMPAEEQGLFFPRGLYSDDEVLFGQIGELQSKAETFTFDPDMSLLLGYQLIGVERNDEARQWLERSGQYEINEGSAVILLGLLDKLEEQSEDTLENNL